MPHCFYSLFALIGAAGLVAACVDTGQIDIYPCENPVPGHRDANGEPDPCCKRSKCSESSLPECPGQCMLAGPVGWNRDPLLLWLGPAGEVPKECPTRASRIAYRGSYNLTWANDYCSDCACGDPACVLPSGLTASTLSVCPNDGPGAILTPFDAPAGWDGSCTAAAPAIPANKLASITIAPLTVSPCAPKEDPTPAKGTPVHFAMAGLGCLGVELATCKDSGHVCVPTAEPPPPGFLQCIVNTTKGDELTLCPEEYPDQYILYQGWDDHRSCTKCECGAPTGSDCSAVVNAYSDPACKTFLAGNMMTLAGPACDTMVPGVGLQSMFAAFVTNEPGVCAASGGEPMGDVTPTGAQMFCCQPAPPSK